MLQFVNQLKNYYDGVRRAAPLPNSTYRTNMVFESHMSCMCKNNTYMPVPHIHCSTNKNEQNIAGEHMIILKPFCKVACYASSICSRKELVRARLRARGLLDACAQRCGFTCLWTRLSFALESRGREYNMYLTH